MYKCYEALRDERHMTNAQVAVETGISPSTFTDWKTGRIRDPRPDKLMKIAKLFHVTLEQLIGEVD